jgi:hypothetical protein
MRRFAAALAFVAVVTVAAIATARAAAGRVPTVVHEWGTFTSIADSDGGAVQWTPQAGPSDLPCFVARNGFAIKGGLRGTVRMETPVIYFYAPAETRLNVGVRFNGGVITEWFPKAAVTTSGAIGGPSTKGSIVWTNVVVDPRLPAEFPIEPGPSHYYKARETDAVTIASGGDREGFLFYRGVGTFAPPIAATVSGDGSVVVSTASGLAIRDIVRFENRGGAVASEVRRFDSDRAVFAPAAPLAEGSLPLVELEQILIANGLYEKEAHAMVETWRDSWFEEGARLIYIVPSSVVDAILPLDITPAPSSVVRVFVGRLELVTPETLRSVATALEKNDRSALDRYGRFLEPILRRLGIPDVPSEPSLDHCNASSTAS